MKTIRVLIVDDSAFMRKAIRRMLSLAPDIEVVGSAADGQEALEKTAELKPDIVTMDVQMAGMDGLTALARIMRDHPTPVIMLSSLTQEGAEITLKALDLGAVDFIDKARVESSMNITLLSNELIAKVRTIAGVDVEKMKTHHQETDAEQKKLEAQLQQSLDDRRVQSSRVDIVAIGTSTGGPPALQALVPKLPPNFPSGVVIVQHMPVGFTRTLAERLNAASRLPVTEAAEGDLVQPGHVLIAPAGKHLKLRKGNGKYIVHLDTEPSESLHKPSVDTMMESVAKVCGKKCLGVLLTGMGADGAKGMRAIKEAGGSTLAESEETCIVYGMPKSAVEEGVVDKIAPIYNMINEILKKV